MLWKCACEFWFKENVLINMAQPNKSWKDVCKNKDIPILSSKENTIDQPFCNLALPSVELNQNKILISHKIPNFKIWLFFYRKDLLILYDHLRNYIKKREYVIADKTTDNFEKFAHIIYKTSSKRLY
jgi:hypothetical protein